jgi:hypothetical protein
MASSNIIQIPQVIFNPPKEVSIPPSVLNNNVYLIPSAKYYYGDKIPVPGSENEDLKILYSLKIDDVFPLLTVYAKSRNDQIGRNELNRPSSQIALSMKNQLRQYSDREDWFYYPRFDILLSQMKGFTTEKFIDDFYKFPLNPNADAFTVARLLEDYLRSGCEIELRKYLEEKDSIYLLNHSFDYYPLYNLFFLLTRFYSYPMEETQIQLSIRRFQTKYNSPERIFIDSVFNYQINNIQTVLDIVDQISVHGPEKIGLLFNTTNPQWFHWGNEYLAQLGKIPEGIENLADLNYIVAEKLYTWTDNQIEELCKRVNLVMPYPSEYPTRKSFVEDIAAKIGRFKADPRNAKLWNQQVLEKS